MSDKSGEWFKDLLTFRKMVSPVAIQIYFWISVAGFIYLGIKVMDYRDTSYSMYGSYGNSGGGHTLEGLLVMVVGIIISRIFCEFMLVLFRIYETLKEIRGGGADDLVNSFNLGGKPSPAAYLATDGGSFAAEPLVPSGPAGPPQPTNPPQTAAAQPAQAGISYCSGCGGEIDNNSQKFCIKCGMALA
ncbi:MAG: DUF4282 domain-containing protein [Thermoleophilia bacterium]